MQYMGSIVFTLPISLSMIVRIFEVFLNIIIKSEICIIRYCIAVGYETMVFDKYLFKIYNQGDKFDTEFKTLPADKNSTQS